ncbi:pentatricopeptide repeat-containing protein, partial [Trifolium medium]|nr:pentatricopeptide repeat-containing protein [Trifolium medium]
MEALKIADENNTLLRKVNPHFYLDCSFGKKANDSNTVIADSFASIDKELLYVLLKNSNVVAIDHLLQGMMDKKIFVDNKVISTIIE